MLTDEELEHVTMFYAEFDEYADIVEGSEITGDIVVRQIPASSGNVLPGGLERSTDIVDYSEEETEWYHNDTGSSTTGSDDTGSSTTGSDDTGSSTTGDDDTGSSTTGSSTTGDDEAEWYDDTGSSTTGSSTTGDDEAEWYEDNG